jgi:hypothetical protein
MFSNVLRYFTALASAMLCKFSGKLPAKRLQGSRWRTRPAPTPTKEARGIERRLTMHRLTCLQAYQMKAALVRRGAGNHTMRGIPDLAGVSL